MNTERPSYKPFETRLIQLLKRLFEKSNLEVSDHLKVGDLPLEIDIVACSPQREWTPDFGEFPRLFHYFRQYNIMEVKTEQDRLEIEDLPKLMAYGWLYMARHYLVNVSEVTITALVHHLPSGVEEVLPLLGFKSLTQGIYWRDSEPAAYIISFINIPDELLPEELRAFADPVRRQQTFIACLGNKEKAPLVETIFDLYESEVIKIMLNIREESLKNILLAVGEEKILAALDKQKIQAALSKEDHLAAIDRDDMINALLRDESFLKALLARIKPEQLQSMLKEEKQN